MRRIGWEDLRQQNGANLKEQSSLHHPLYISVAELMCTAAKEFIFFQITHLTQMVLNQNLERQTLINFNTSVTYFLACRLTTNLIRTKVALENWYLLFDYKFLHHTYMYQASRTYLNRNKHISAFR